MIRPEVGRKYRNALDAELVVLELRVYSKTQVDVIYKYTDSPEYGIRPVEACQHWTEVQK